MDVGVCLFGCGPEMESAREDVEFAASCEANILIGGERGVGKRLIGKHIHRNSRWNRLPLALVRCARPQPAVQSDLLTAFDQHPGTIVLDDVGELTPDSQRLLSALLGRHGAGRSPGEWETRRHVRVIACASAHLYDSVRAAAFREELFYRLNTIRVSIPPLRDRREDIPGLILRLLGRQEEQGVSSSRRVTRPAMARLVAHGWPGNVRELEQVLRDVSRDRGVIRSEDLPQHVPSYGLDAERRAQTASADVPIAIAREN